MNQVLKLQGYILPIKRTFFFNFVMSTGHITPIFHSFCCTVKLNLLRNKMKSSFLVLLKIVMYELKI